MDASKEFIDPIDKVMKRVGKDVLSVPETFGQCTRVMANLFITPVECSGKLFIISFYFIDIKEGRFVGNCAKISCVRCSSYSSQDGFGNFQNAHTHTDTYTDETDDSDPGK